MTLDPSGQLLYLVTRDDAILERAKAGGDAIGDHLLGEQALHRRRSALDLHFGRVAQLHLRRAWLPVGHGHHLLQRQRRAVQHDGLDLGFHQITTFPRLMTRRTRVPPN